MVEKGREGGRRKAIYAGFLGTISEQRGHSRTAICGNRPTGRAVTLDLHWPSAKLGERLPVSREGCVFHLVLLPSPSSVHFSPWILFLLYTGVRERGCREGNNRTERLSVSRLPSNLRFDTRVSL